MGHSLGDEVMHEVVNEAIESNECAGVNMLSTNEGGDEFAVTM